MLQRSDSVLSVTANTQNQTADVDLSLYASACVQAVYSDATPAAKTFVAADVIVLADTITIASHGFFTGLKVALTGTNLPTGLSATNYWVIRVDANTIKLASSLALAVAGTPVDITAQGTTADAALTPATISQVVKLQASNDGTNFSDISGKTVTVTAAGNTVWDLGAVAFKVLRVVVTPASGAMTLTVPTVLRT
jgi:hypothetical protein